MKASLFFSFGFFGVLGYKCSQPVQIVFSKILSLMTSLKHSPRMLSRFSDFSGQRCNNSPGAEHPLVVSLAWKKIQKSHLTVSWCSLRPALHGLCFRLETGRHIDGPANGRVVQPASAAEVSNIANPLLMPIRIFRSTGKLNACEYKVATR